jgi:anaerobic ribonucleoside-triphosphate reductase activating protein
MLTVAKFDRCDMVNSPKSDKPAFTIWFSGCSQRCSGCYNPKLWDKSKGEEFTTDDILGMAKIEYINLGIDNIVFLGGEPMEQDLDDLISLARELNWHGLKVWMYTSWDIDEIPDDFTQYLYTIKCGKYDETLKCDGIPSSTNQKFYRNVDGKLEEITF